MTDMLGMNRKAKNSDELYDIFLKHLDKESVDTETVQDLIYEVVAEYFSVLFGLIKESFVRSDYGLTPCSSIQM